MRRLILWGGAVAILLLVLTGILDVRVNFRDSWRAPAAELWTTAPADRELPAAFALWVELAKATRPAVVNVSTRSRSAGTPMDDFFRRFFEGGRPAMPRASLGTGFLVSADGYVVTNNHVVAPGGQIIVKLDRGSEHEARVVGTDPATDLALLKIEVTGVPVLPFGDSDRLQVAEPVMAIGNPFGLDQTVTTGIVSATGRVIGSGPYDDFIQTDASINPGNSGGPLINAQGQAIGINTAIFSRTGGSVGIGFAIPANLAKSVVAQLAQNGRVVRGWLGVTVQPLTDDLAKSFKVPGATGALVAGVADGSPAMAAGLKPGDVITEYDGRKVARSDELPRAVADTPSGHEVPVTVIRDGKPVTLTVKVGTLEDSPKVAAAAAAPEGGTLGVSVQTVTPELARELKLDHEAGAVVRAVREGSPAASAGVKPGDVITEVNRKPVASVDDLRRAVEGHAKGTPLVLMVHREGTGLYIAVNV